MILFRSPSCDIVWKQFLVLSALLCLAASQAPPTTPVPILKQINKQNDDGSYSFGYEAADGTYKIETKYPSGDVAGKYGYVDDTGKLREVEYGASSKSGFEPKGSGIDVPLPPPTLADTSSNALSAGDEDDGQYREDPSIYEDPKYNSGKSSRRPISQIGAGFQQVQRPAAVAARQYQQPAVEQYHRPSVQQYQQPALQQYQQPAPQQYQQPATQQYQQPATQQYQQPAQAAPQYQQAFQQQYQQSAPQSLSQVYHQQPQFTYQQYQPQNYQQQSQAYSQQPSQHNLFAGHPAQDFDINTGSYSIRFTG